MSSLLLPPKPFQPGFSSICQGEAVAIPGFSNLHEMSSDPVLEKYLKILVGKFWESEAMKKSDISIFLKARKKMAANEIADLKKDISDRIDRGILPKIFFTAFAPRPVGGKRIHVVTIYKYEMGSGGDGSMKLYAWETN